MALFLLSFYCSFTIDTPATEIYQIFMVEKLIKLTNIYKISIEMLRTKETVVVHVNYDG